MNHIRNVASARFVARHAPFIRQLAASMLTLVAAFAMMAALWPARAFAQADVPPPPAPSSLIVKLAAGLTLDQQASVIARNGGVEISTVPALRLHVVEVGADGLQDALLKYQSDAQVTRVEVNAVRQSNTLPSDPMYGQQWALPKIGWDSAFGSFNATSNVVVAVLDTGIDAAHPDLAANVIAGTSILDGSNGLSDPSGHGTMVAGTVAAQTNTNPPTGIAGVGYAGVRLMPVTVLNADGLGQDSDIINGVVWAVDHGADVILMAFSNPGFSASLQDAIDYAWSSNVVLVAATGNDALNAPTYPAGDRGVIGVSATDENDQLAGFSNYGASVFLAAPGANILTTDIGGSYVAISGTSSSAAIVAGAAAQIMAVDPSLANGVVVGRLARTADPAGTQEETGNGRINLARALLDTGTDFLQPAGAGGTGGPFVGPYRAAARNASLTFVGTGTGSVTITPSTGTVNAPVSCGGTGTTAASQTVTSTCSPNITISDNSATITFGAAAGANSFFAGWSAASNLNSSTCSGTTNPCSAVLGGNPALTVTFTAKTNQTISVTTPALTSAAYNATFNVAATASSGLAVAITTTGGCTGSGTGSALVTMTSSTSACVVHYNQAGNANFNAAPEVTSSTIATKANQTITFGALAGKTFGDADFTVSATASSGLVVTFAATGNCTVSSNTVHVTDAGSCTITASQAGDANYNAATNVSQSFTIAKAASTTTLSCPTNVTYSGSAQTPCAASVTGAGGLSQALTVNYTNNVNAGTANASASFAGDANHTPSTAATTFTIDKASSTTLLTCPASVTYNGSAQTPCTATVTGAGGLNQSLAASYTNNTNAGLATASATFGGDANHNGSNNSTTFTIDQSALTITANNGSKAFGQALTFAGTEFVANGLLGTDTVASVTLQSAGAAAGATAGQYPITPSTAVGSGLANYVISYVPGTLTVEVYVFNVCDAQGHCIGGSDANDIAIGARLTIDATVQFKANATAAVSLSPATLGGMEALSTALGANNQEVPRHFTVWIAPLNDPGHPSLLGSGEAAQSAPVNGISAWTTTITAALNEMLVPGNYTAYLYGHDGDTLTGQADLKNDGYFKPDTSNFEYPTLTAALTVIKADQTITFGALPDRTFGEIDFTVSATASSGLEVSFAAAGNCTISGNSVQITGAGSCTITASQAGNSNYTAAPDVSRTFNIAKATSITTVTCPPSVTFDGSAQTPCTATVAGAGGLSQSLHVSYADNTNAGTATASASFAGDANHEASSGTKTYTIAKAESTTTLSCPTNVTYDGSAQMPCAASVTGAGGLSQALTVNYTNNVNAGTANASASFAGDANHTPSTAATTFTIDKASSTTLLTCPASVTYNGSAQTPCTATVTGAGGLNQSLAASYTNNTNAGLATASATFGGDANHNGSSDSKNFTVEKASSTTVVTFEGGPYTYRGTAYTATAKVTGAGGLSQSVDVAYAGDCVNVTTANGCTVAATFAGDANHNGSSDTKSITINKADPIVTATGNTCTYDGDPCAGSGSATGVLGEPLTPVALGYSISPGPGNLTSAPVNVGNYLVAARFAGNANYNGKQSAPAPITISKASSATLVSCPASVGYNGSAQTPCSVSVSGAGGLNLTPSPTYADNTNAGTATASYTYAGDANHNGSSDVKTFTIAKASSTTTVTCPAGVTYTGLAQTPCTAAVSGAGGLAQSLTPTYLNNTNAGTATASASYAEDANHTGSSDSKTFAIAKASSTTAVTCPAGVTYTGLAQTPCTASVIGTGGLNLPLPVFYADNTNAGTVTASASFGGDANHLNSAGSATFVIAKASTITMVVVVNSTFDGTPHGASATVTGPVLNLPLAILYSGIANDGTSYGPSTTAPTNAGQYSAAASYAETGNYLGSSDSRDFAIAKANQTIGLSGVPSSASYGATFTVGSTITNVPAGPGSGKSVVLASTGGCINSDAAYTMIVNVATPVCGVSATLAGNSNYNDAASVTLNVNPSGGVIVPVHGEVHVVDPGKWGVCGTNPNSGQVHAECKLWPDAAVSDGFPEAGDVVVRLYDLKNPTLQSQYGKDPGPDRYRDVYTSNVGLVGTCVPKRENPTPKDNGKLAGFGEALCGAPAATDILVLAGYKDFADLKGKPRQNVDVNVVFGKKVDAGSFKSTPTNNKLSGSLRTALVPSGAAILWSDVRDIHAQKTIRKDPKDCVYGGTNMAATTCIIQYADAGKSVYTGSYLEIIYPTFTMWDEGQTKYLYPFIMSSDSEWSLDVCAAVPQGYQIVGVFDADGSLVASADCVQAGVAGETKIVAFEVVDLQSPPPHLTTKLKIKHKGKTVNDQLDIPGKRKGRDK